MKPHPSNACAGHFDDWLEVNLLSACNARCSWCVEKAGYRPKYKATWLEIANAAIVTGKKNIVLLGGEPLLYKDLALLLQRLTESGSRNIYLTTNGQQLTRKLVAEKQLHWLTGINISIHHYDMRFNRVITGLDVGVIALQAAIKKLRASGVQVRFNCNVHRPYIDTNEKAQKYIKWALEMGADSVRFAEIKNDDKHFVSLAKMFPEISGLNEEPFLRGCHVEGRWHNMPISFRQMCGLHTKHRPPIKDPEQTTKPVLYYDAKLYPGWVLANKEPTQMTGLTPFEAQIRILLKANRISEESALYLREAHKLTIAERELTETTRQVDQNGNYQSGPGCVY